MSELKDRQVIGSLAALRNWQTLIKDGEDEVNTDALLFGQCFSKDHWNAEDRALICIHGRHRGAPGSVATWQLPGLSGFLRTPSWIAALREWVCERVYSWPSVITDSGSTVTDVEYLVKMNEWIGEIGRALSGHVARSESCGGVGEAQWLVRITYWLTHTHAQKKLPKLDATRQTLNYIQYK